MKTITREQILAECCVPEAWLEAMDKAIPFSVQERVAELELLLNMEVECALATAQKLTNDPDAEPLIIGGATWREAYIATTKRHVRQMFEIRFWVQALSRALLPTPPQSRH